MGRAIDYDAAADILSAEYDLAEESFHEGRVIEVSPVVAQSITRMFESRTQSHREMALGCVLAFIIDSESGPPILCAGPRHKPHPDP